MPTRAGTQITYEGAPGYVAEAWPFDWLTICQNDFLGTMQSAIAQGQPKPLSWWQKRPRWGPEAIPQGVPFYLTSRPYSRGAEAHAPKFGILSYNPIGGGTYNPYKLPPCAGPGATHVAGSIWFDVQGITTGLRMNRTVPIETVDALIHQARVSAAYRSD